MKDIVYNCLYSRSRHFCVFVSLFSLLSFFLFLSHTLKQTDTNSFFLWLKIIYKDLPQLLNITESYKLLNIPSQKLLVSLLCLCATVNRLFYVACLRATVNRLFYVACLRVNVNRLFYAARLRATINKLFLAVTTVKILRHIHGVEWNGLL